MREGAREKKATQTEVERERKGKRLAGGWRKKEGTREKDRSYSEGEKV